MMVFRFPSLRMIIFVLMMTFFVFLYFIDITLNGIHTGVDRGFSLTSADMMPKQFLTRRRVFQKRTIANENGHDRGIYVAS